MKTREVVFSKVMISDLGELADFIVSINSPLSAERYIDRLNNEIESLVYLADTLPLSRWKVAQRYNENAKHYITHNKIWHVVFHTTETQVIIYKLTPSKMIIE